MKSAQKNHLNTEMNTFAYHNFLLTTGHVISSLILTDEPMVNAVGYEAIGWTQTIGKQLSIRIKADLSDEELSVTLYHEVLEALTVAVWYPPASVTEFAENDFDQAAYAMHEKFGPVTPENLNLMLQFFGFGQP